MTCKRGKIPDFRIPDFFPCCIMMYLDKLLLYFFIFNLLHFIYFAGSSSDVPEKGDKKNKKISFIYMTPQHLLERKHIFEKNLLKITKTHHQVGLKHNIIIFSDTSLNNNSSQGCLRLVTNFV